MVAVSYVFVFAGAWNDRLIGLTPSAWSQALEWFMALVLALEIVSRILYSARKDAEFFVLLGLDIVSILTVIPALTGFAFARLARLGYASWRIVRLVDALARKRRQPMYLVWIYPLIVPLAAALLYAVERGLPHPAVRNYLDALGMCLGFALTLGSRRPAGYAGNIICGILFVGGILCIGIIANGLSRRYELDDR